MTTMQTTYGYGHTKEAAAVVREQLNNALENDKQRYGLKIRVRKADSGYGGPRVTITTSKLSLDKRYEYIIDENGQPADSGQLVSRPVSEFTYGRPHHSARLVTPEATEALNKKINAVLAKFGKDEDDAMTDYFNNTMPLFYGVGYER